MAFDPEEFQRLADWLMTQRTDEASLRTSISRLYYSAHLIATRSASAKGWFSPTGRGKDHGRVIRALRSKCGRIGADQLQMLLEFREHADYHLDCTAGPFNARCDICEELRRSPGSDVVTLQQWQEASEIGARFITLMREL